ncbi:hypothetical protein K503DRAFT_237550 [Rhizopogon vinicolor AM-OR11-026]|uniref:Uncharacterized protein n=1 Tax=Rhizopogon vinicolor AM-OR11-026 TaxID=1314800 RepID=A0A1B7MXT1_9AGAM|nr:hypothetical protein K503DRAFT_237550 [Rhizopogon vinicolor AM-OR11-026]
MAQSTTTTVAYSLAKYSRSYPTSPSSSQIQPNIDAEWQHFVHPVINLYLDAKKSSAGHLVSVRLRIVWKFDSSTNSTDVDQREITLEDLDLLSFSSLSNSKTNSGQPDHGLPLKAVYRDAVVGIRYLHPRTAESTCQPVYRRFQITFTTAMDATQFIDAVRPVCPCKLNPQPSLGIRTPTVVAAGPPHDFSRRGTVAPSVLQSQPSTNGTFLRPASTALPPDIPSSDSSLPTFTPSTPGMFTPMALSSSSTKSKVGITSSNDSTFFTPPEQPWITVSNTTQCQAPPGSISSTKNSLPDSSQPSSSNSLNTMPPPPLPSSVTRSRELEGRSSEGSRTQLLSSLRDTPALYNLSHAELESMVAEVIREEGFVQLLASLDTLWRVKGFLGQRL